MKPTIAIVEQVEETEQQILDRARAALSNCNWTIGECAASWTRRYAKGRTDADFGDLIGMSDDQVSDRRRVWEQFMDVSGIYRNLSWSHFKAALTWDDSSEFLQWAEEMEATVAEMRAYRRAQHGEDLTQPENMEDAISAQAAEPAESGSDQRSKPVNPGEKHASGPVITGEKSGSRPVKQGAARSLEPAVNQNRASRSQSDQDADFRRAVDALELVCDRITQIDDCLHLAAKLRELAERLEAKAK